MALNIWGADPSFVPLGFNETVRSHTRKASDAV